MPNGTGKTTTLQLLRAALSGAASDWPREKLRSYAKRDNDTGQGRFVVHLLVNDRRVSIAMHFDFGERSVRYTTTEGDGMIQGHRPPHQVARFLRPGFV